MAKASVFQPAVEDLGKVQALSGELDQQDEQPCDMTGLREVPPPPARVAPPVITRTEIADYGNQAFLLHGAMSSEECKHYIDQGEKLGFEDIPSASPDYRNMKRIMFMSEELADLWWSRISPYLDEITIDGDPHSVHIHGISALLQGTWRPVSINKVFRLCRYPAGGHFAPHFDGHLVRDSRVRSMKTCMLYLNEEFQGGTTNFIDENQRLYKDASGKYRAEEENVLCRVKPERGATILFNHHRLHEGEAIRDGIKYMMRTDVMYERCSGPELNAADEEALQLAQEAERLEGSGESMKAMELYRKAFKLSPSLAQSYGN